VSFQNLWLLILIWSSTIIEAEDLHGQKVSETQDQMIEENMK